MVSRTFTIRTIFSVPLVIFGLFPIRYLEHSHEVFEWIILFISGIWMLITALTKLPSEVCSFFFSTLFRQCQAFRDLEKGPQTKMSVKNLMYLLWSQILLILQMHYFSELVSFSRSWKPDARAFAKIRIITCATQLENNWAFWLINRKLNTNYFKNIDIFSLSYCL